MKIEFAPGCFDNFDGTQEELDELMKQIQDMFDSGEAQKMAVPIGEMLDDLTEEEIQALLNEVSEELSDEELGYDFQPQNGKRLLH